MDIESKIYNLERQISRLQYLVGFLTVVIVLIVLVSIGQPYSNYLIYRIDLVVIAVMFTIFAVTCWLNPSQDAKQRTQTESSK